MLEKCFNKEDNEDKRASGTSPEQNETKDAICKTVEQLGKAAIMHQEMITEKKKKKTRQASLENFGETPERTKSNEEKSNGKTPTEVKCTEAMKYLRERAAQEN